MFGRAGSSVHISTRLKTGCPGYQDSFPFCSNDVSTPTASRMSERSVPPATCPGDTGDYLLAVKWLWHEDEQTAIKCPTEQTANCVQHDVTQTLTRHSLPWSVIWLLRFKYTSFHFYGNKESTTLLASIFAQLTNAQQHHMHISYTRFHPNWTVNVERTDMN
jgi:hypothetical protein